LGAPPSGVKVPSSSSTVTLSVGSLSPGFTPTKPPPVTSTYWPRLAAEGDSEKIAGSTMSLAVVRLPLSRSTPEASAP
jgi:hypothetical protein